MKDSPTPLYKKCDSSVHRWGLFAAVQIKAGMRVVEYTGTKITKKESDRRGLEQVQRAKDEGDGSVYIFELNKRYDLDGNTPDNVAKFINHSCDPNCEAVLSRGHIWIEAVRDIAEGEELSFDYGYDMEHFLDHPCRCGTKKCIGYIVAKDQRAKVRRLLRQKSPRIP